MKSRSVAIYGALALLGLLAAWRTWQSPEDTAKADQAVILDATRQTLERVRYDDGTRFIDVTRRTAGEPRLWVTLGYLPGKFPAPDAGVADGGLGVDGGVPAVAATEPPPTRTTPTNERGETLWARFTPFVGTRALGVLPQAKLEELGLVDTGRTLEVTVAGAPHRFMVAKASTGTIGSYLMDERTKGVFLIPSTVVNELDPASTMLVDRRLHRFTQKEFDAFTVTLGGLSADFVVNDATVARKDSPETPDELAKNWSDKVLNRLVVTDVLGEGELPKAGAPVQALRIEYRKGAQVKGWLEMATAPDGAMVARSENTGGWVTLHQNSDQLLLEAQKLVSPRSPAAR